MRNIIKNKRADIGITILVIGVVLICIYALVSFFLYNNRETRRMIETDIMEEINSKIEKYYLYKNVGYPEEQIGNLLGIQTDAIKRKYLYAEKIDKGNKDKKLISVKYFLQ